MEIHDEVAAQIQNCQEDFEYIDGVSSIADDDLAGGGGGHGRKSRLSSLPEDRDGETKEEEELEEIKVDTFRVIGVRRKQGECLVREIIVFYFYVNCSKETFPYLSTYVVDLLSEVRPDVQ